MLDLQKCLGERIVEAARLAVRLHLRQVLDETPAPANSAAAGCGLTLRGDRAAAGFTEEATPGARRHAQRVHLAEGEAA